MSAADLSAAAARLQDAALPPLPLCLAPNGAVAAAVKSHFPAGGAALPIILPLPQLLAAAAVLPLDKNIAPAAAALEGGGIPPSDGDLVWRVYAKLSEHCGDRYGATARLQLAQRLVQLFGEADAHLPLAAGDNPFAAAGAGAASHEMQVAAAMWDALAADGVAVGLQPLMRRLAPLLPPLLAVCDESTTPVQRAFYAQCASAECIELPLAPLELQWRAAMTAPGQPPAECRHRAWQGVGETLAQTAALALAALAELLAQLPPAARIGIVVEDRLLARRLRALAEAEKVLIADSAGWRAESLSYGAALRLYAQAVCDGFSLEAVAALLAPPFYTAGAAALAAPPLAAGNALPRAAAEFARLFEQALDIPADSAALLKLCTAQRGSGEARRPAAPHLAEIAADLDAARRAAEAAAQPPAQWLDWLQQAAQPALAAWREDALAQTLQRQLRRRAQAVEAALSAGEFLLWLQETLAAENIASDEIDSRIAFVGADSARAFDALLLLGAAAMPTAEAAGWLGEGEREALGLPLRRDRVEELRRRFCRRLLAHTHLAAVWCAVDSAGMPQRGSPFWQVFAAHCRAHGQLHELAAAESLEVAEEVSPPLPAAAVLPPSLNISEQPLRVWLSAVDTLMECPYKFYATALLGLGDTTLPDTSDMPPPLSGILLHRVLAKFSQRSKALTTRAALAACWDETLRDTARGNRAGLALLRRYWQVHSEAFIDWEWQRRTEGWQTVLTEQRVDEELPLPSGAVLQLAGRLDRMDEHEDGAMAVIDYKSGTLPSKGALSSGELPQLPLYAFFAARRGEGGGAAGGEVSQRLLYRPLHRNSAQVAHQAAVAPVAARLRQVARQIDGGAALPAHGAAGVCAACGVAGVCRRAHWQQPAAPC